jgi:hypothetical protein
VGQGLLRLGTDCWVIYPGSGRKPVAEGIVGSAPPSYDSASGGDRSYLNSLREAGQQYVTVTKVHRKGQVLMYLHTNPLIRQMDEVLAANAVCDRTVRWSARYLIDKAVVTET